MVTTCFEGNPAIARTKLEAAKVGHVTSYALRTSSSKWSAIVWRGVANQAMHAEAFALDVAFSAALDIAFNAAWDIASNTA